MRAVSKPGVLAAPLACAILAVACGIRSPLDGPSPAGGDARGDASAAFDARPEAAAADASSGSHDAPVDSPRDVAADAPADSPRDSSADAPADAAPDSPAVLPAPRPVAPLSTSTVTSQQPTFRWVLDPGSDGAQVEICFDRGCTRPVETFTAQGTNGRPPIALAAGVYFWRLHGTSGVVVHAGVSPTWEVFVGAHSAPVDTSWGSVPDLNADGLADALVGQSSDHGPGVLFTYAGSAKGLAYGTAFGPPPPVSSQWFALNLSSAGDVDGDGYPEVLVGDGYHVWILAGGPAGPSAPVPLVSGIGLVNKATGAGDVDGDGYADVVLGITVSNAEDGELLLYRGGRDGLAVTPWTSHVMLWGFANTLATSDLNGDGYGDVVTAGGAPNPSMYVYTGGPGGLSTTPLILPVGLNNLASAGDVDGDGYGDLLISGLVPTDAGNTVAAFVMLGGPAGPSMPRMIAPPSTRFNTLLAGAGDFDGDGYADVLIGQGPGMSSSVAIYYGAAAPALPASGPGLDVPTQTYGYTVFTGLGDVNGDGLGDVLVGSSGNQASYLFSGQKRGRPPQPPAQTLEGSTSVL